MREVLKKIHGWPEEARKLLAGALIVVFALVFFSAWGSFVSSRLASLGPPAPPAKSPPPVSGIVRLSPIPNDRTALGAGPPSPAVGIAQTLSGLEELFPRAGAGAEQRSRGGVRALFAAMGEAVASGIEFLYLKLSRYVPPNL